MKIAILVVGSVLSILLGIWFVVSMSFAGEFLRGPSDALATFCSVLAAVSCLLPGAAAIYKVSSPRMSVRALVLCWALGPIGMLAGTVGYDFFFPRNYAPAPPVDVGGIFAKFKNATADFASENPGLSAALFRPAKNSDGTLNLETNTAKYKAVALARKLYGPIYINEENGDATILAYPYGREASEFATFVSTQKELNLLKSGKPASAELTHFLANLPSAN